MPMDTRRDARPHGGGARPGRARRGGGPLAAGRSRPDRRRLTATAACRAVLALGIGIVALAAATGAQPDRRPPAIERLEIVEPPRPEAPLGARVAISTDEPARLTIEIADGGRLERRELDADYRTAHVVPLVGLRPGRTHAVTFIAIDAAGNRAVAPPLTIDTEPLPDDFPPLAVTVSRPERMEPGATLLNVYRWGEEERDPTFGLLVAVDASGDVVWYYRAGDPIGNAVPLANGNLLYMATVDGAWAALVEIDLLGNVIRRWHSRALAGRAPAGSVLVDTDSLHHDMVELPSGNLVALGSEARTFDDYPTSEEDPEAPRATQDVGGDLVVEFAPDGTIVQQWSLLDALDPYRIGYGSLNTSFWGDTYRALGRPVAELADWAHANALAHDPRDDVGGDVGTEPVRGIEAAIEDGRIAAAEQGRFEAGGILGETPDLVPGQGQELMHGGASCQRLAVRFEEREVLRPAQNPASRRRVRVDDALQVRQQVGCALHLVEDGAARELRQETPRVLRRKGPFVRRLERPIRMTGKHHPAQRGLPALPRTGERNGRRPSSRSCQFRPQVAMDHAK